MKPLFNLNFHQLIPMLLVLLPLVALYFLVSCTGQESGKPRKNIPVGYVDHPEWSKNANIYEVNVRQYTPEGTFRAFAEHLPRLKNMGVDILWLMPIHPIGEINRKGTLGSYYSVKDYKGVNPEFGDMEDFKDLVKQVHDHDMKIILDWVANHTSWDHDWIKEHPEWYTKDSLGSLVSPFDWSDVVDLNYDEPGLREAMTDALEFWVREANIDGYRCDVAGMVPTEFWEDARKRLDAIKPVFMLAEAEEPEHHIRAFDMSYAWELHHLMNQVAKGKAPADTMQVYYKKQDTLYPANAYRMLFTSNHDENSWNGTEFERMGEGAKTFAVLTATLPGMPMIYSGQESAFDERLEFFEKDTIDWGNYEYEDFYRTLLQLKHENQALWNGEYGGKMTVLKTGKPRSVFAFARDKGEQAVITVTNLSPEKQDVEIRVKRFTGTYLDLFSGSSIELGSSFKITLAPWEYRVFVK